MKSKIRLDTMKDIQKFVAICSAEKGRVILTDKTNNYIVNAKSIIGCLASMEFSEIWCESENDIYSKIKDFTID